MAPLSFHLRHHTSEVELPIFFLNLKKITLSTPFIAGIQGTDVKGSTIFCAPYGYKAREKSCLIGEKGWSRDIRQCLLGITPCFFALSLNEPLVAVTNTIKLSISFSGKRHKDVTLKSNLELTKPCILIHCFLLDMPYWLLIVG
jgi:hypothetical protein